MRERWRPKATAPHQHDQSMRGTPHQVIEELDPKTIKELTFEAGKGSTSGRHR
jgi:hypothetical protein